MFDRYQTHIPDKKDRIGRTSFLKLVRNVTKDSQKLLSAVHYVTGELVNDAVQSVQEVIGAFGGTTANKETLTTQLEVVRNFLKVQYDDHAKREQHPQNHYFLTLRHNFLLLCG